MMAVANRMVPPLGRSALRRTWEHHGRIMAWHCRSNPVLHFPRLSHRKARWNSRQPVPAYHMVEEVRPRARHSGQPRALHQFFGSPGSWSVSEIVVKPHGLRPGPSAWSLWAVLFLIALCAFRYKIAVLIVADTRPADQGPLEPVRPGAASGGGSGELNAAASHLDLLEICSTEFRQRNAASVRDGAAPSVLAQWDCKELKNCRAEPVQRLINSYHERQLTDLLEYVPCDLYKVIQGRTLWMLGDSQIARWYRQLRCFMAPLVENRKGGGPPRVDESITDDPALLQRMDELLLKGYKTDEWNTVWKSMVPPFCTHLVGGTRICHGKVHLAQQLVEKYLPNLGVLNVSTDDVLILNVGLWHHPSEKQQYRQVIKRLAGYCKTHKEQLPLTIWRETSLQHFRLPSGEYPNPGEIEKKLGESWKKCAPLQNVALQPDGTLTGTNEAVVRGGWRNAISTPLMREAGMPIMPAWNESLPMHELHEPNECTHFCTPGGYNVWTWQLWRMLRELLPSPQQMQGGGGGAGGAG